MSKFERFEDIVAWQKARVLVAEGYKTSNDGKFAKDFGLKDQFRRAAVSVMSNIAEGFARRTNKEFTRFLFISHGSVAEVQSLLYVALDQNYINDTLFKALYEACDEISKMISGLISYLEGVERG
jgi:four helix bundle protein